MSVLVWRKSHKRARLKASGSEVNPEAILVELASMCEYRNLTANTLKYETKAEDATGPVILVRKKVFGLLVADYKSDTDAWWYGGIGRRRGFDSLLKLVKLELKLPAV